MNLAAVLRLMQSKGLSFDDTIEIVEAMESAREQPVSKGAERTRRWRERNAEASRGDVTSDAHSDVTGSPKEIPPTPPKEITPPSIQPLTRLDSLKPSPKAFDEFWLAYPRKVGKGAAKKAFPKALGKVRDGDPVARLMGALATAKRAWANTEAQFIPHPATWLNQERWEDEPLTPGPDPPNRADDGREREERLARVEAMTPEERQAHFAEELEKWQRENPNLRAS